MYGDWDRVRVTSQQTTGRPDAQARTAGVIEKGERECSFR